MRDFIDREILVSIYCLTYNHIDFIRDALEGFVNQKTNFFYEVVIHDDASTDGTAEVIREYEKKYPDLIKPIYQKENQYSKNVPIIEKFIIPAIHGKYVAICEGDDYWTFDQKLQLQVDFLERNPSYAACAHSMIVKDYRNNKQYIYNDSVIDYDIDMKDIIEWQDKRFLTASVMLKKELLIIPEGLSYGHVGDWPRAINLMLNGGIYYFHNIMAVYRANTPGSWSVNNLFEKKDVIERYKENIKFLDRVDEYTNKKYNVAVTGAKRIFEFQLLLIQDNCSLIVHEYSDMLKDFKFISKMKIYFKAYFPELSFKYKSLKKHVQSSK